MLKTASIASLFLALFAAALFAAPLAPVGAIIAPPQSSAEEQLNVLRQGYQAAMTNYLGEIAQFERDRLLYQRHQDLSLILEPARQTYGARRDVLPPYTRYLTGLLQNYVPDTAVAQPLADQLALTASNAQALTSDFADLPTWYQADTDFSRVFASLNETAYQSFAQIYWHELNSIIETYTTLYQNQNLRILDEASSQIDRERKAQILGEALRSLQSLQTQITTEKAALPQINSQRSYADYLIHLNQIQAQAEASLKQYAGLE